MNLFSKLFGIKTPGSESLSRAALEERNKAIQDAANKLWELFDETLQYYNTISCQCAFPRFLQYTRIDCVDYRGSFYMSETEGFIQYAQQYYTIEEVQKDSEAYRAVYTCKKCASTFDVGWSDFSISVSRTFLKPIEIKTPQVGADIKTPIPFFVGLFGHKLPQRSLFEKVDLKTFETYIKEIR